MHDTNKMYTYSYDLNYDIARQISVVKRSTKCKLHSNGKLLYLKSLMTIDKIHELDYQNNLLKCNIKSKTYDEIQVLKEQVISEMKKSDDDLNSHYRAMLSKRLIQLKKTLEIKKPKTRDKKSVVGSIYNTGSMWSYKEYGSGLKAHKF